MKKITVPWIRKQKSQQKITVLTAYDFPMAKRLDECGVDMILVGDSIEMVKYGSDSTLSVDMETMLRHTRAVSKAVSRSLVIADMPFLSYQTSIRDAIYNAGRFLKEAGANAIKLEGGAEMADTILALTQVGIPVVAHIGLTPQSVHAIGGFKRQGKTQAQQDYLIRSAKAVAEAGAFCVVLECVEEPIAKQITDLVSIPTIGIGSSNDCDGQVLVTEDLLGLGLGKAPPFVNPVSDLGSLVSEGIQQYINRTKGFRPGLKKTKSNQNETTSEVKVYGGTSH